MKQLKTPLVVLNFKTYIEATGKNAVRLAEMCSDVSKDTGITIIAVPQLSDIRPVAETGIPAFAQHIDGASAGGSTGHVLAEAVCDAGAVGTLINHSERRLTLAEIDAAIQAARRTGIATIVCSNNIATTKAAAALKPDFVAIEPPELIGTGIPVSTADPGIVSAALASQKVRIWWQRWNLVLRACCSHPGSCVRRTRRQRLWIWYPESE